MNIHLPSVAGSWFSLFAMLHLLPIAPGGFAQTTAPRTASEARQMIADRKLRINGGISATQTLYGTTGIAARRSPHTYFVNGHLTFSIFSLSVPLSFSYTNQEFSFSHQLPSISFNQYGIQPTWKWLKFYAGYNTLTLSPYTMNGHLFLGGGIEATPPGHISLTALYGRFRKASPPDHAGQNGAFRRMGYGIKTSIHFAPRPPKHPAKKSPESIYTKDGELKPALPAPPPATAFSDQTDLVELIVFGAKDQSGSLPALPDTARSLRPEENLALSARLNKTFLKKFSVNLEVATSALTADTRIARNNGLARDFFAHNTKAAYYNACRGQLSYSHQTYTLGLGYERVDPEYRTHGAYYFNNDFENITFDFSAQLWQGKLSVSGSAGSQRNNLNDQRLGTLRRASGAVNIQAVPHPRLNLTFAYSSFQSFTRIRNQFDAINQLTPFDNLRDSLNFTQIAQNASAGINYQVVNHPAHRQFWSLNTNVQSASNQDGNANAGTIFYNVGTSYNLHWNKPGLTTSFAFNYSQNEGGAASGRTIGPTLSLGKTLLKKTLRILLSASLNNSYLANQLASNIVNLRLSGNYTLQKKHRLSLNILVLKRYTTDASKTAFTEFTGTLGYNYSF